MAGDLVPQEAPKFMIWGLCVSLQCGYLTSYWWKEPWSRNCRWRIQVAKGTEGNFTNMTSSTTRLSSTIPYLLFHSISYSWSSLSFFSSSSSFCSSSLRMFGKPPGLPSSPAGTFRTGSGLLHPKVQIYWRVSQDSYFQIFVILTEPEELI